MECIVRFNVLMKSETKQLRGLIFVKEGELPSHEQLIDMFKRMKYDVRLADPDQLLFKPVAPTAGYTAIRVTELDTGEKKYTEDRDLKAIVTQLMPPKPGF